MEAIAYWYAPNTRENEARFRGLKGRDALRYAEAKDLNVSRYEFERYADRYVPFLQRPNALKLIDELELKGALIVPDIDCLFRTAQDGADVISYAVSRRVHIHCLSLREDLCVEPMGTVVPKILACISAFEKSRRSTEAKELKLSLRSKGRYLGGGIPLGFLVDENGTLKPDESKRSIIRQITSLRDSGKSLRQIAQVLTERGIAISHMGVKAALASTEAHRRK
jgi:DNA invertase Pin-like site-specific DNA recombinase